MRNIFDICFCCIIRQVNVNICTKWLIRFWKILAPSYTMELQSIESHLFDYVFLINLTIKWTCHLFSLNTFSLLYSCWLVFCSSFSWYVPIISPPFRSLVTLGGVNAGSSKCMVFQIFKEVTFLTRKLPQFSISVSETWLIRWFSL